MATAPKKSKPNKVKKKFSHYKFLNIMSYSLNTTILEPMSKTKPKNAVILCHGYGGDGKDISILAKLLESSFTGYNIYLSKRTGEMCCKSKWISVV